MLQAAKDVVLAEKPVISDDSNQIDPTLLDELLANIATLSSVYHKPPEAFVTRVKTITQRTEDDEYPEGTEPGYSESSSSVADGAASPPSSSSYVPSTTARQPIPPQSSSPPAAAVPDLLGDLIGLDNSAIVPVDQPATSPGYDGDLHFVSLVLVMWSQFTQGNIFIYLTFFWGAFKVIQGVWVDT